MAQFYGSSKAWKEIEEKLETLKLRVNHPSEINALLEDCMDRYAQQLTASFKLLEQEIVLLEQDVNQERAEIQKELATNLEKFSLDIEQAEATLDFYQHDKSTLNPLRNSLRTRREAQKLERLRKKVQEHRDEIEKSLRLKETELEQKKSQKEQRAREQCSAIGAQIEFLKTLAGSQELASAQAELEMQEYLQSLPDNVHVINHLKLRVEHGFRQGGKWLIHGQIDNLVVSPAGLFAIQVQNWSKQHPEKSNSGDLGKQINDAAQLCFLMIKPNFPGVTVRSILAYRGHLPENEKTGIVKVLPLQEVCAYISWFRENSLNDDQLLQIVTFLQQVNQ